MDISTVDNEETYQEKVEVVGSLSMSERIDQLLSNPHVVLLSQLMETSQYGKMLNVPGVDVCKFSILHGDAHCARNYEIMKAISDGKTSLSNDHGLVMKQWYEAAGQQVRAGLYEESEFLSSQMRSFSGNFLLALLNGDSLDELNVLDVRYYRITIHTALRLLSELFDEISPLDCKSPDRIAVATNPKLKDLLSIFISPIRFSIPKQGVPATRICQSIEESEKWVRAHRPDNSNLQVEQIDVWDRVFMYYGWEKYIRKNYPQVVYLMNLLSLYFESSKIDRFNYRNRCITKQLTDDIFEIDRPLEWLKFRNRPDQLGHTPDFWWGTRSYRDQRTSQFNNEFFSA